MSGNGKYKSTITIALFSTAFFLFSCQSHEQPENAFDRVKEEKTIFADSPIVNKPALVSNPAPSNKFETADFWASYRIETEKKITLNENRIKELKSLPKANAELFRKVTLIEKNNFDLRRQLDVYNEEVKVKWEKFKTTMNHDVNEIDIQLKDLMVINKK